MLLGISRYPYPVNDKGTRAVSPCRPIFNEKITIYLFQALAQTEDISMLCDKKVTNNLYDIKLQLS